MRTLSTQVLLGLFATAFCAAQVPSPPEALSAFDAILGNWEGSGKTWAGPGRELGPWTAVSTASRILDGHFVQEDVRVDIGEMAPAPIIFRSIYAWNPHTKRYVCFSMSNLGFGGFGKAYWTADRKLVSTTTRLQQGIPVTEQSVTEYAKDAFTFRLYGSGGGGAFFLQVEGTFRRGKTAFSASQGTEKLALVPVAEQMRKLEDHWGTWTMKGKLTPMPGAPALAIAGSEEVRPILGGHAHMGIMKGDPVPGAPKAFRGFFYLAWDPEDNCYRSLSIDNFGFFLVERGYLLGERKMISTSAPVLYGVPHAIRGMGQWSEDGSEAKFASDRLAGDAPADRSFEGVSKRVKD